MKTNDVFYADTHAEFLNNNFGTNYKQWMKSVWKFDNNTIVWMVRFDKETRDGWRNSFIGTNELLEENLIQDRIVYNGDRMEELLKLRRIVIAIDESGYRRKYIFKGVFVLNEERENTNLKHYLIFIQIDSA